MILFRHLIYIDNLLLFNFFFYNLYLLSVFLINIGQKKKNCLILYKAKIVKKIGIFAK